MTNIFDKMASEVEPEAPSSELTVVMGNSQSQGSRDGDDIARTPLEIKAAIQELLKHGYLEESNRQDLFRRVMLNEKAISKVLEPLDLTLRIDSHRGVAFLTIAPNQLESEDHLQSESEDNEWTHPLVRKQRLTLEQSLLVAILRQAFVIHEQETGVGHSAAKLAVEELLPTFLSYFGESGSDSRDENRLLQLLDQLKSHGIVSEVDKKHEITIRPLIAHIASPTSLSALLRVLKDKIHHELDTQGID